MTIDFATTTTGTNVFSGGQFNILPNGGAQIAAQAPPTRNAPPREFNRYISASDLLEEFIRWLGDEGLRQRDVAGLPLEHFIKWLVIRACEEDQEEPNVEMPALPAPRMLHRCVGCGRFMPHAITLALHAICSVGYFNRVKSVPVVG
tara:strand:+ start:2803 stop:3243 length:441 start_codon:yes stop_codon:yes gene_type:complete